MPSARPRALCFRAFSSVAIALAAPIAVSHNSLLFQRRNISNWR
jgi:hypothetical protein